MTLAICVWPKCEAAPTQRVNVPLCDHHAALTYRRISHAMKDTEPTSVTHMTLPRGTGNARPNQQNEPGTVYIARCGALVKIGFTTKLRQRMQDIGADEVLGTFPGTRHDERALHYRFGHAWAEGEYFRPCPEIDDFLDTLRPTGQTTAV